MRTVLLATFVLSAVLLLPAPALAMPSCGQVITSSVTLTRNLNCDGTALYIGADNVTVDLNGHTLTGDGTGDGISVGQLVLPGGSCAGLSLVPVTNVTVENGRVRDFDVGIRPQPFSTHIDIQGVVIAHNGTGGVYAHNPCGLPQRNDYVSITDNSIHHNAGVGTETGSREASNSTSRYTVITANEVYKNGGNGIQLDGYSDFATVDGNHVHDNGGDGIRSIDSISTITSNLVDDNGGDGINVTSYAPTTFGSFYSIADNTALANAAYGIFVDAGILDGGGNVAHGNGTIPQCVNIAC